MLTRRQLLSMMGFSGVAVVGSGCRLLNRPATVPSISAAAATPAPAQSAAALAFEKKYDIRFITKALNEERQLINTPQGQDVVLEWSDERIKVLDETLSALPDAFYRGKEDRRSGEFRRVHLALLRQVDRSGYTFGIAAEMRPYMNTDPVVLFLSNSFPTTEAGRPYSRSVIVHELAHKVSNLERTDSYEAFFRPTGMRTQADVNTAYRSILSEGRGGQQFTSATSYGASNLEEHGAIAAEHYFLGKDVFFKGLAPNQVPELGALGEMGYYGYVRFLGEENTNTFYEALKKNMFSGREYKNQQPI